MPFRAAFPIRSLEDVGRLEQRPLQQALTLGTTHAVFAESAAAFGEKTALSFLTSADPSQPPLRLSYQALFAGINQTANLLHRLGIGATDVVAVLLPGCLEYQLALWGGEAAGIVQPLNPLLSLERLLELLQASGAKALMAYGGEADAGIWSTAHALHAQRPDLTVLRVAPHDEGESQRPRLDPGVIDFAAERAREPCERLISARRIASTDIAAYIHTGGTTGTPKLAMHSHGNQVFAAWAAIQMSGLDHRDVTINGYPLFHVAGIVPGSLTPLSAGVEVVIPTTTLLRNRQVIQNYWKLVQRYRVTSLSAVPTVLSALTNVPVDGADISSIRYCRTGAAPLPPEVSARFKTQCGLHVHESLGMTETCGVTTITPLGVSGAAGCVGYRIPYSRLRIMALNANGTASDRELPAGETGMVLFRAPNVFPGFLDPATRLSSFDAHGWLVTGDLGWLDEHGRLNLTGRVKDVIIRSGHNIDPKVIEDALGAHAHVQLCAAVGAPDPYAGELPVAFAVLTPEATVSATELMAFAAAGVDEPPARPKRVYIIEEMPVTNVGKIYKPELRRRATQAVILEIIADHLGHEILPPLVNCETVVDGNGIVHANVALDAGMDDALRNALRKLPVQLTFGKG